ncbi:hypothetical protein BDD30_1857 [Photorhabdus asymbiotica]|uniref:Uncharacterized protein n=1 Tax=Photorhabdus asymbiotica TaxID=291112 RepID=A0ABX9SP49_9GAMM|nr:hypothetical protein BDD30_1857 [Photorhabdus asymbiotica]
MTIRREIKKVIDFEKLSDELSHVKFYIVNM